MDSIRGLYYGGVEARGTLKHQCFGNFLAFSKSSHQLGPEKPCGARKSQKFAKWVTLADAVEIADSVGKIWVITKRHTWNKRHCELFA